MQPSFDLSINTDSHAKPTATDAIANMGVAPEATVGAGVAQPIREVGMVEPLEVAR